MKDLKELEPITTGEQLDETLRTSRLNSISYGVLTVMLTAMAATSQLFNSLEPAQKLDEYYVDLISGGFGTLAVGALVGFIYYNGRATSLEGVRTQLNLTGQAATETPEAAQLPEPVAVS